MAQATYVSEKIEKLCRCGNRAEVLVEWENGDRRWECRYCGKFFVKQLHYKLIEGRIRA